MAAMRLRTAVLCLGLALPLGGAPALGEDAPKPGAGQAPAPAPDPAMEDREAEFALRRIRQAPVSDVMEGLESLSHRKSGKVTKDVVDIMLGRAEFHVAEYGGAALAACDPEGALKVCEEILKSPKELSPQERRQLAGVLAFLPAPKAPELLAHERLLRSRDDLVRRDAIRGLGLHRSALVVDAAIDALSSKNAGLRNAACVALGRAGDKRAATALIGKLDETDGGTAGFAAIALGRLEDDSIFPVVAQQATTGKADKCKALVACARPKHADRLRGMLKAGANETKIAAAAALGKIQDQNLDTQKALLETMLGDGNRWVRTAAFSALGRCATPELTEALLKRMGQKDSEKLMYVLEIAGDVRARACADAVGEIAWSERNDILRRVAMDSFWRIGDPDAITAAEKKMRSAQGNTWVRSMEFLSLRRNRNGFDLALELMKAAPAGSKEQFEAELCLERQTGHFFGPDIDTWNEWISKNPKFFEAEQASVERAKWREEFLKENSDVSKAVGSTTASENSVQLALDYLARHQDPSGAFDQQHFLDMCVKPGCPVSDGSRVQFDCVGVSGLCTLAFFGAACEPGKGRYGGVLDRAMEYMLSRQLPLGDYVDNDLIGGYNRPIALQAYAEASNVTHDPQYLPFIQRGVDFLACIQAEKGGWRYRVVDNANDTSVTAWVLFGAQHAAHAGAHVRRSILEGCDLVLKGYQTRPGPKDQRENYQRDIDPRYAFEVGIGTTYQYHTGYQNSNYDRKYATTGLGLMSRILIGYRRSHPFCIGSANQILDEKSGQVPEIPAGQKWEAMNFKQEYPMYHMYYGTLAMHQMGGRYFRDWNKVVKDILTNTQEKSGCNAGSWQGWNFDRFFSRLYTTAIGAMTLETYYRYAPILQD
jgi:HEAT repeat protein